MTDIDNLTIKEVKEIQALLTNNNDASIYQAVIGQVCVIRTYSAGVHIGKVLQVSETTVLLENSNRLYQWREAFTLSEVSQNGIGSGSRIACAVPKLLLTQVIEILPTTEKARNSYEEYIEN